MAPKIHLVRHAQGFHNLCQTNSNIHDPLLTPRGKEQCTELQANFPYHAGMDLIVSSPIRRTLYTSLLSFEHDIKTKGLTIIAFPEVQETSDLPCDTGSSPEELAQEFSGKPIDFSLVTHGWNVKTGRWSPTKEAIAQRALEAREWLIRRPESEIVVVTHGNFRFLLRCCSCCCHCCTTRDVDVATATATKLTRLHRAFTDKALELTLTSQAAFYTTSLTIGRARTSSRAPAGQTPSSAPTRLTSQGMRQATQYCATAEQADTRYRSNAHLIETEESKQHRAVKPLDHNEVTQIKRTISRETADKAANVGTSSQGSQ